MKLLSTSLAVTTATHPDNFLVVYFFILSSLCSFSFISSLLMRLIVIRIFEEEKKIAPVHASVYDGDEKHGRKQ